MDLDQQKKREKIYLTRVRLPEGALESSVLVGCELLGRGFFCTCL